MLSVSDGKVTYDLRMHKPAMWANDEGSSDRVKGGVKQMSYIVDRTTSGLVTAWRFAIKDDVLLRDQIPI